MSRTATVYPADDETGPVAAKTPPSEKDDLAVEREISARTRRGSFSGQKRDPLVLFNSPEWRRLQFAGSTGHEVVSYDQSLRDAICAPCTRDSSFLNATPG